MQFTIWQLKPRLHDRLDVYTLLWHRCSKLLAIFKKLINKICI